MKEAKRFAGQIAPRLRGRKTHVCAACDYPIAVYGRCAPCLHAYCLTCAASMPQCIICKAFITKLERIPAEAGLFISPLTLQGFRTEADLAKHAQQLEQQLQHFIAATAASGGSSGGGGMLAGLPPGQPPPPPRPPPPQHQQQQGWKPPPPPLPPGAAAGGFGRQQQQQSGQQQQQQQYHQQQQQQRHMAGPVMRPR